MAILKSHASIGRRSRSQVVFYPPRMLHYQ